MPRFFLHIGGTLGLGLANANMQADRYGVGTETAGLAAPGNPEGTCSLRYPDLPPSQNPWCVRVATGGLVPHAGIRVQLGYYVLPFFGIAAWARFAPVHGAGDHALYHFGGRVEFQLTNPAETGPHAHLFAGGGFGQIQIQPPGNPVVDAGDGTFDAPYIISGLGNLSLGGYVGYRFIKHFGLVGQVDMMFQLPTFLFNLDITVSLAVGF